MQHNPPPKPEPLIRGLSLFQPWASLMAVGAKKIETRSRLTKYRGLVAIASSLDFTAEHKALCETEPFHTALGRAGISSIDQLHRGVILAVGLLADCRPVEEFRHRMRPEEHAFGNYGDGRFGWAFAHVHALEEPIAVTGMLGLYKLERSVAEWLVAFHKEQFEGEE